jgi:hypothetical protein
VRGSFSAGFGIARRQLAPQLSTIATPWCLRVGSLAGALSGCVVALVLLSEVSFCLSLWSNCEALFLVFSSFIFAFFYTPLVRGGRLIRDREEALAKEKQ